MERDAFGRFLTTSMLPKLAELWEARKILYFVATNHINYFDSAVIRSQRFDALILVSPPSFRAKVDQLSTLLSEVHGLSGRSFQIEEKQIQEELDKVKMAETSNGSSENSLEKEKHIALWREEQLNPNLALAKFALLRYDELDELAYRLASILKSQPTAPMEISPDVLREALKLVADSEWRKNKSYADFLRDTRAGRRDYRMLNVWEVTTSSGPTVPGVVAANGGRWLSRPADVAQDINIPGFELSFKPLGLVEIRPSVSTKLRRKL